MRKCEEKKLDISSFIFLKIFIYTLLLFLINLEQSDREDKVVREQNNKGI
jgi:hypothetical protein